MQTTGSSSSIADKSKALFKGMLEIVAKRADVGVPLDLFTDPEVRVRFYDNIRLPRKSDKYIE